MADVRSYLTSLFLLQNQIYNCLLLPPRPPPMAMASPRSKPHFLLFPFMAQGHMIPMIDLAKLLAQRGAICTIVTTPLNAARFDSALARAIHSGLQIHVSQLQFPWEEAGLPHGCENLDMLTSMDYSISFFRATNLLYDPSEKLFEELSPRPTCIISDMCLPWTLRLSQKYHIPRLVFYSLSFFFLLCMRSMKTNRDLINSMSDSEFVTFSNLPDQVEFRKSELPKFTGEEMVKFASDMREADMESLGVILNIFEEMEPKYLAQYRKERKFPDKVWCVGPVSICNENRLDKAQRGNKACIDEQECTEWLDGQQASSVVYVSLGSLCNLLPAQLIELGLGLEASKKPFIWVIRKGNLTEELQKWLVEYGFEEKTKGRGLVIRGWAPQVLILSHPAIGCFLTHCGWNSSIEGLSAGVPMITWPLFADQVFNEKLMVQILRVGISVSVETEEKEGVVEKREKVREAIEMVMDGDEREERRERCKQFAEMAKRAVEEGGSSHRNLTLLIEDIVNGSGFENGSC